MGDPEDFEPDEPAEVDEEQYDPIDLGETVTEDAASKRRYRKKVREQKKALAGLDEEDRLFWQQALEHPIGRRIIWGLLTDAHTFDTAFACGPSGFPQPEATWFKAGEQAFGLRLYQTLLVKARAGTLLMQDEHDIRFKPAKQ